MLVLVYKVGYNLLLIGPKLDLYNIRNSLGFKGLRRYKVLLVRSLAAAYYYSLLGRNKFSKALIALILGLKA